MLFCKNRDYFGICKYRKLRSNGMKATISQGKY